MCYSYIVEPDDKQTQAEGAQDLVQFGLYF